MGPSLSSNAALLPRLNKLNATTEKKKITSFAGNFKKSTDGFVEFGFASKSIDETHKTKQNKLCSKLPKVFQATTAKKMSSKQEICTNSRMKKSKGKKTSFSRERYKWAWIPTKGEIYTCTKKAIFTWISLVEIGLIVTAAAVLIIEIAVLPG
ncbi:hypothetical protein OUZ56_020127 [Daphnia magna]|uniref:Uncharacterized protein n=1 Tax=Daphnia magna TaxID=35525 RepID=A0ABQ9ZDM3_9CRUS|nr:hypothetical protein OUZ56_020127 [Daphnia magna]